MLDYDKTTVVLMRLGTVIIQAIDKHGAPNTFSFSELVGCGDAMAVGKAAKSGHWGALLMNVSEQRPGTVIVRESGRLAVYVTEDRRAIAHPVWFADCVEKGSIKL